VSAYNYPSRSGFILTILMIIRRVCEVVLHGNQTFDLRQQKYKVSEALKTGEATALFGKYLISCGAK
jgi:hypothetical protein